ncbi:hypothetical protein F5146DRAFT_1225955 [Armillaria mellea]|nr:hypothetical protein F5146DRAFT_1225955 [Armillaria mellea]
MAGIHIINSSVIGANATDQFDPSWKIGGLDYFSLQVTDNKHADDVAKFAKYAATVISGSLDLRLFGSLHFVHDTLSQWETIKRDKINLLTIKLDNVPRKVFIDILRVPMKDLDLLPFSCLRILAILNFDESHIEFWTRTLTGLMNRYDPKKKSYPLKQAFFDFTFDIPPDISGETAAELTAMWRSIDKLLPLLAKDIPRP